MSKQQTMSARDIITTTPELNSASSRSYYKKREHFAAKNRLRYYEKLIQTNGTLTPKQSIRYLEAKVNLLTNPNEDKYGTLKLPRKHTNQ